MGNSDLLETFGQRNPQITPLHQTLIYLIEIITDLAGTNFGSLLFNHFQTL